MASYVRLLSQTEADADDALDAEDAKLLTQPGFLKALEDARKYWDKSIDEVPESELPERFDWRNF
jgi:hypothetical protein